MRLKVKSRIVVRFLVSAWAAVSWKVSRGSAILADLSSLYWG